MIRYILFFVALQLANYTFVNAQITEDFSDGDLTSSPAWHGEISNFIVNDALRLQLMAPAESSNAYLATASQVINKAEWSFYVQLKFNPSSRNYTDIYLVSDDSVLTNPLNGYFVRIGNTRDEVSLYRQTGDRSDAEKIIDGRDDVTDQSEVELRIKVIKSEDSGWELYVDEQLDGSFTLEGQVRDDAILFSKFAGIACTYTKTRADKFFFDDLRINGEIYTDQVRPWVDSLSVVSDSSIFLKFSEKMDVSNLSDPASYEVDHTIGRPARVVTEDGNAILLEFSRNTFVDGKSYQLTLTGLQDLFSNPLTNTNFVFAYHAPYIIGYGDILITEIMADPSPGVDLPEHEYLEIYNPKEEVFTLEHVKLIVGQDTSLIPTMRIKPDEYIILCPFAAVEHLQPFGATVRVPNWPSLNNRGERIILINKNDEVVYSVAYEDTWYKSIDKDDGGWSLEMIDTAFPCRGHENWTASAHAQGGTPGSVNSINVEMPDLTAPNIASVIADTDSSLTVYLDENIGPGSSDNLHLAFQPGLEWRSATRMAPQFDRLHIELGDKLSPGKMYQLEIAYLKDCADNLRKSCFGSFVLPQPADSNDIVINEVLFNPKAGGVDFVEIYNRSDKYINLSTILIGNESDYLVSADHLIIHPKQLMAITEDPEALRNQYPGAATERIFKVKNLPQMNDDEGYIRLVHSVGKQIDLFHYNEEFHSAFLKDVEGVSLERIDYERPTNDPSNWQSAASTAGFATPGSLNSQFYQGTTEAEEVQVDPQVFDPGNNGFYDFTMIKCRFPNAGYMANIRILDAKGREIRTIIANKSVGTEEDFKWEGTDNEGRAVKMGPYIVMVEVYDASGKLKLYRKKVVVAKVF